MTEKELYEQIKSYASQLGKMDFRKDACVVTMYEIAEILRVQPSSVLLWHSKDYIRSFDMNVPSYYGSDVAYLVDHHRGLILSGQHTCLWNMCEVFFENYPESEYTDQVRMLKDSHVNKRYYDSTSVPTPIESGLVFQMSKSC